MIHTVEDELIRMDEETKEFLIESTDFLDFNNFILNQKGEWVLWYDWMTRDQFDVIAKLINFIY